MPQAPAVPQSAINAEAVKEYESSDVETAAVNPSASAEETKADEDWFVFEEVEEAH